MQVAGRGWRARRYAECPPHHPFGALLQRRWSVGRWRGRAVCASGHALLLSCSTGSRRPARGAGARVSVRKIATLSADHIGTRARRVYWVHVYMPAQAYAVPVCVLFCEKNWGRRAAPCRPAASVRILRLRPSPPCSPCSPCCALLRPAAPCAALRRPAPPCCGLRRPSSVRRTTR